MSTCCCCFSKKNNDNNIDKDFQRKTTPPASIMDDIITSTEQEPAPQQLQWPSHTLGPTKTTPGVGVVLAAAIAAAAFDRTGAYGKSLDSPPQAGGTKDGSVATGDKIMDGTVLSLPDNDDASPPSTELIAITQKQQQRQAIVVSPETALSSLPSASWSSASHCFSMDAGLSVDQSTKPKRFFKERKVAFADGDLVQVLEIPNRFTYTAAEKLASWWTREEGMQFRIDARLAKQNVGLAIAQLAYDRQAGNHGLSLEPHYTIAEASFRTMSRLAGNEDTRTIAQAAQDRTIARVAFGRMPFRVNSQGEPVISFDVAYKKAEFYYYQQKSSEFPPAVDELPPAVMASLSVTFSLPAIATAVTALGTGAGARQLTSWLVTHIPLLLPPLQAAQLVE